MKLYKTILFTLLFAMAISSNAKELYTSGKAILFQSGFIGKYWHPYLKYTQYDSNDGQNIHFDLLTVILKSPDPFYSYPSKSKLLLKFSDNSIVEMESFANVVKDFENYPSLNLKIYHTGRNYIITKETLQKLLTLPIVKIRIELEDGHEDYSVGEKLGKKILKKLVKAQKEVQKKHNLRIQNASSESNDDF